MEIRGFFLACGNVFCCSTWLGGMTTWNRCKLSESLFVWSELEPKRVPNSLRCSGVWRGVDNNNNSKICGDAVGSQ